MTSRDGNSNSSWPSPQVRRPVLAIHSNSTMQKLKCSPDDDPWSQVKILPNDFKEFALSARSCSVVEHGDRQWLSDADSIRDLNENASS